jgi:hypothetical protein
MLRMQLTTGPDGAKPEQLWLELHAKISLPKTPQKSFGACINSIFPILLHNAAMATEQHRKTLAEQIAELNDPTPKGKTLKARPRQYLYLIVSRL